MKEINLIFGESQCPRFRLLIFLFYLSDRKRKYLMSGFFRCGTCGNVMVGYHRQGNLRYQCARNWKRPHEEPCPTFNLSIVSHKVDDAIWDWICWFLLDDVNLKIGLNEMVKQRESNIEDKRRNLDTIISLISKQEKTIKRLVAEMAHHENYVVDAFRKEVKAATDRKKALEAERDLIINEIEGSVITEDVWNEIFEMAARLRERLLDATYKNKRWIMDVLNVRVKFIVERKRVSLIVYCDLPSSHRSIELRNNPNAKKYDDQLSNALLKG